MRAIKENIVGLVRFIGLLLLVFIPHPSAVRRIPKETEQEWDKYGNIIGHASEPLIPTESYFCPVCHVFVAHLRRDGDKVQIIENNKVVLTTANIVVVGKSGKEIKGLPISCPNGHSVRIT